MTFARKNAVPLSQMKERTASGMRALAGKIDEELPGMAAPQHLRDAARALESGNHTGAKRHLQAAMHTMAPLSLMRHGILDDDGHAKAKVNMDLINRHHMLVSDLEDGEAHNQGLRATPATFTQPGNLPMGDSMNPLKLPGAAGPDGGPGVPKTVRAAMVPAPAQNTGTDRAMAGGPKAPSGKERQLPGRPMPQAVLSWDDIDRMIELSAQTARLAATPAPRGRPGGPGLYDVEGMGHTAYLQQIVKALIRKRGMDPGKAYAIARGAIRRWSSGGGKVHPEVRAASAAAEGGELTRQARAKAVHGHTADSWAGVVELVGAAAEMRDSHGKWQAGSAERAVDPQYGGGTVHVATINGQPIKGDAHEFQTPQRATAHAQQVIDSHGAELSGRVGKRPGPSKPSTVTTEKVGGLHYAVVNGKRVGLPYRNPGMAIRQASQQEHTADSWAGVVELVGTAAGAALDPRAVNGQFGSGGAAAGAAQMSPQQKAAKKQALLAQAAQLRAMAVAYTKMLAALTTAKKTTAKKQTAAAAAAKATKAATAAATKAGSTGKTASSTPAKKTVAAKTPATIAHSTFKAKTAGMSKAQQVGWLRQAIKGALAQAAALTKQAAAL